MWNKTNRKTEDGEKETNEVSVRGKRDERIWESESQQWNMHSRKRVMWRSKLTVSYHWYWVCVCVLCSQCSQKIIKLNVDKFIGGKSSIHKTPKLAPRPAWMERIYSTDKSDYTLFPLRFWALIRGEFIYHRSWRFAFVIPFNLFHCVHSRIE